jgi:DNA-directed RNA polymerase subunit RPC12/RpoP
MASISTSDREQCPRCGSGSTHLEWHERVKAQQFQNLWRCWNCDNEFITAVTSDEREPSVAEITAPFFTSLVV